MIIEVIAKFIIIREIADRVVKIAAILIILINTNFIDNFETHQLDNIIIPNIKVMVVKNSAMYHNSV